MICDFNCICGYGDFCYYYLLVCGSFDLVIELDVNIFDVVVLVVIVCEVGGVFIDLDGVLFILDMCSVLVGMLVLYVEVCECLCC